MNAQESNQAGENAFEAVEKALSAGGSAAAYARLAEWLERAGDFHRLFELRLMQARHDLGQSPLSRSAAEDLPADVRGDLEERMVDACREIGQKLLACGRVVDAHAYLEMIGEVEPVRIALETMTPQADDLGNVIDLALSRGLHPVRGVELVLEHFGLCQAISACESLLRPGVSPAIRDACLRQVIRAAHDELTQRIAMDIEQHEGTKPEADSVASLIKGREWLFADDNYHLDTSHLNAVVRMARILGPCEETEMVIDLCTYGRKLSSKYRYPDPPPFEDLYEDSLVYFQTLKGGDADAGVERFRQKAVAGDPAQAGTYPSEVYLHLLAILGRPTEGIDYLESIEREWPAPFGAVINGICEAAGNMAAMARLARRRGDVLTFLAARLAPPPSGSPGGGERA